MRYKSKGGKVTRKREKTWRRRLLPVLRKWVAGLALILLLLTPGGASFVTATPAASNGSSWLRIRTNLSDSPTVISGYPDMAISDDGNELAVVWTEGYSSSSGAKHHGRVYLRWISEDTGLWSPKIAIDNGANSQYDWARGAAVALRGTTAHVVWVRVQNNNTYSVWYRSCGFDVDDPGNDECKATTGPFELESETSDEISSPDIAVDGNGNVFVVWAREDSGILYREYTASSWQTVETISAGSEAKDWPVIGVGGGTVYAVWIRKYQDAPQPLRYDVWKRHKTVGGAWESVDGTKDRIYDADVGNPSRHPQIVSSTITTTYAIWDTYDEISEEEKGYRVVYKYFNTDNIYWQPPGYTAWAGLPDKSTDAVYNASKSIYVPSYAHYLRPALTLDGEGHLHAVWHYYDIEGDDYIHQVMYSSANNPTAGTPTWSEPVVFAELGGDEDLSAEERRFTVDNVAARIAVGGSAIDPHIHVVLMLQTSSAWDVWYLSNQFYKTMSLPVVMKNY